MIKDEGKILTEQFVTSQIFILTAMLCTCIQTLYISTMYERAHTGTLFHLADKLIDADK